MRTITLKEQRQRVNLSRKLHMSRTRRNFSAKFKSALVLEVLKGERNLFRADGYRNISFVSN